MGVPQAPWGRCEICGRDTPHCLIRTTKGDRVGTWYCREHYSRAMKRHLAKVQAKGAFEEEVPYEIIRAAGAAAVAEAEAIIKEAQEKGRSSGP